GALLRDVDGELFVDELAPRDVVSRAMAARMLAQGVAHLWLDATGLESFSSRFPTIAADLAAAGLDPAVDWLPIAPAAHYCIGGVLTDLDGASALPGLWAAGEVACAGVHGANRLASNSLLEGMVFAARVVEAIGRGKDGCDETGAMRPSNWLRLEVGGRAGAPAAGSGLPPWPTELPCPKDPGARCDNKVREQIQHAMTTGAGVVRDAESLGGVELAMPPPADRADVCEVRNLATVGQALVTAAAAREESRGCHTRTDCPETVPALARRFVIS
ncbi:MAG: FAD-binding protein, partial [Actinomycetota bacterium]|nr:FAD-binding protein [Actinomycetota bacterium]